MSLSSSHDWLIVVLLRIGGVAGQAILFTITANVLSLQDMGIFSAVYVFWGLCRMLGPVGLDQIILRDISYACANNEHELGTALCWFALSRTGAVSLAIATLTALTLGFPPWSTSHIFSAVEIALIACTVPACALVAVLASALRGCGHNIWSQAIETIGLHLLPLVFVAVCSSLQSLLLVSVVGCQAAAFWVTVGIYALSFFRPTPGTTSRISPIVKDRIWSEALEVWQALALIGMAASAPTYISLILLGSAQTALLEIALRFGTLPTIFTTSVSMSYSPILAGLHARNERKVFGEALTIASWLAFVPSVCVLVIIFIFGEWLLSLFFPSSYTLAYVPLLIIVAATTINAGFGLSTTAFLMTGHQRIVRMYSLGRLLAVIISCVLLGSTFGIAGFAFAILIGFSVLDVGLAQRIQGQLKVSGFLTLRGLFLTIRMLKHEAGRFFSSRNVGND